MVYLQHTYIKSMQQKKLTPNEELYIKAKEAYYKGKPIMTDVEFDTLEDSLRDEDSFVVDIVGAKSKVKLSVKHLFPMLSLAKIKFKKDYIPFTDFISFFNIKNEEIEFGPKLDGNAITCLYDDGALVSISSRGDGEMGQNHTQKLKSKVPSHIKNFSGEIRGEVVIDVDLFNQKYLGKPYKNARNFVAGVLGSDFEKSMLDKYADIDFIAFDVKGQDFPDVTKWLASKGFEVLDFIKKYNINEIDEPTFVSIHDEFANYRKNCKYQLDGIVAKYTKSDLRTKLGEGGHHPNWALAIKFIAEEAYTTIISIEWNLTKTGKLAPVAILKPVELMGSTVQRASVYNASWMLANKCLPGAEIVLVKSGDIIPRIVNVSKGSDEPYHLMTEWNNHKVKYDGVQLVVEGFENTEEFKAIKLHNAVTALGFKNIGPATCEQINKAGLDLNTILSQNPDGLRMLLLNSGVFKDGRELELLVENFFELTEVELWEVIYSLGYKNCGRTVSKQLSNWMTGISYDFKGLEKAVIEMFINGDKAVNAVKDLVKILENNGIKVIKPKSVQGLITYELTGEPTTHPTKSAFMYEVEQSGKVMHTSLKADTMYLVTNSLGSMTGKMQKAEKNGTKIVTYDEFLEIVKNA